MKVGRLSHGLFALAGVIITTALGCASPSSSSSERASSDTSAFTGADAPGGITPSQRERITALRRSALEMPVAELETHRVDLATIELPADARAYFDAVATVAPVTFFDLGAVDGMEQIFFQADELSIQQQVDLNSLITRFCSVSVDPQSTADFIPVGTPTAIAKTDANTDSIRFANGTGSLTGQRPPCERPPPPPPEEPCRRRGCGGFGDPPAPKKH